MYTYENALAQSLCYFNDNELATNVFLTKYALRDREGNLLEATPDEMHHRLAKEFARIENKKFKEPYTEEFLYDLFKNYATIIPQGSPMYGIGNPYRNISLSNCFVIESPYDSYGGICLTDQQIAQISKRRGGVGYDISSLRPGGQLVNNSAATTSGAVSFMHRFSHTGNEVGQKGRRGAQMISISVHHPDIIDFVTVKNDDKSVTGANISVRLTDEFLTAVKTNSEYELRWPIEGKPIVSRMFPARLVWNTIIHSAWLRAEPGLLFWDNILRESPADCYADFGFRTISTNPSLRKGTLVRTNYGIFPIEQLVDKNNLKVYNIHNVLCDAKCFISGKNKQLCKITFSNKQTIYCTPEHKWPIFKNGYDYSINKIDKMPTSELQRGMYISLPKNTIPINNPDCNFTKDDGFVLGWNLGDGWITYHKCNNVLQYGFIFSYADLESGIGNKILSYCNNLAKRPSNLRQDHDTKSKCFVTTDYNIRQRMLELKAWKKENGIPQSIWQGNHQFITGFIDGLFSSDGYIEYKPKLSNCRIVLVSAYKNIVYDIQKLLSFYGIKSNIRYNNNNGYHRYDLTISGIYVKKFGEIFTLSNSNKNNKLQACILNSDMSMYKNDRSYLVITNVEYTDIYEDVYDITVYDNTHTFSIECGITGNCGEIPLSAYDSCRLLVINLMSCVDNAFKSGSRFMFEKLYTMAYIAQRLMDDLVDLEIECIEKILAKIKVDPEPDYIKKTELDLWQRVLVAAQEGRRTGTGVTACGDVIAALDLKYGTPKSIELIGEIYKTLKLGAYRASVDMAKELGPFKHYDPDLEVDCPFIQRIKDEDPQLYIDMLKYGRRNIACLTTAPVGSVSTQASMEHDNKLYFGTTSGIEPLYASSVWRRKRINIGDDNAKVTFVDKLGEGWMEFEVNHPGLDIWLKNNPGKTYEDSPYYNSCAKDINWVNRVKLQAAAQKHVDHAISSTINLPNDVKEEEVAKIYEAAWKAGVKGITVYRDGCRDGILVDKKAKTVFPDERPRELPCDVHHITVQNQQYFVLVGLLEGRPYEVFAGKNGYLTKKIKSGTIIRKKKDFYKATFDGAEEELSPITASTTEMEECITRLTSGLLRVGANMHFVVKQLEKVGEKQAEMHSFARSICRALKKYIPDGTKEKGICTECGAESLIRQEGCVACQSCGFSKCL